MCVKTIIRWSLLKDDLFVHIYEIFYYLFHLKNNSNEIKKIIFIKSIIVNVFIYTKIKLKKIVNTIYSVH
jgi:hypothetical protein